MKFAILAPGHIAETMARTVKEMPEVERYAVASRNLEKAKAFAAQYGFEKAYSSYEEMLNDPEVELVYVASPHSHHYEHAKMCLEHGKHVLLEKAFTVNAAQAKEIIDLAESKGLLLSEALWTRYMPSRYMIDEIVTSGIIGDVVTIEANLGYEMSHKKRLVEPSLAGGALLDVGVYPINFALMVINEEIKNFQTTATMSEKGVDLYNSVTLTFESGKMAMLHSNMVARTNRLGVIYGTQGFIEVENINNCEEIRVYDRDQRLIRLDAIPTQITGYEYEVTSCINAIQNHKTECDEMPHSETLKIMKLLDDIRDEWAKNSQ